MSDLDEALLRQTLRGAVPPVPGDTGRAVRAQRAGRRRRNRRAGGFGLAAVLAILAFAAGRSGGPLSLRTSTDPVGRPGVSATCPEEAPDQVGMWGDQQVGRTIADPLRPLLRPGDTVVVCRYASYEKQPRSPLRVEMGPAPDDLVSVFASLHRMPSGQRHCSAVDIGAADALVVRRNGRLEQLIVQRGGCGITFVNGRASFDRSPALLSVLDTLLAGTAGPRGLPEPACGGGLTANGVGQAGEAADPLTIAADEHVAICRYTGMGKLVLATKGPYAHPPAGLAAALRGLVRVVGAPTCPGAVPDDVVDAVVVQRPAFETTISIDRTGCAIVHVGALDYRSTPQLLAALDAILGRTGLHP